MRNWPDRLDQLKSLRKWVNPGPILDLGCGDMKSATTFAQKVIGVDRHGLPDLPYLFSMDVIEYLKSQHIEKFQTILMSHIVEHLPPKSLIPMFRRIGKILFTSGRVIILTPNPRNIGVITRTFWGDIEHVRPYTAELLGEMLTRAGMKVLYAGDDPYTRQPGWKRYLNVFRRLIVGDYWQGSDVLVVAEKS